MSKEYDIVIIGLGAMGSAAAYQLSKTGLRVLGLERFTPPHVFGSSHGDTRITRQAVGEGPSYAPLALRSNEIWRELEEASERELYNACGGLVFGSPNSCSLHQGVSSFVEATIEVAKQFQIEHEIFEGAELNNRFPQFHFQSDEIGYFEYGAGYLRPESCIEVQLELARQSGVELKYNEQVHGIESTNGGCIISTDTGKYTCKQAILSAGPFIHSLLPEELHNHFTVRRQVLFWFETELSSNNYYPEKCPVFIRCGEGVSDSFYGFPMIEAEDGAIKVAQEQENVASAQETINREVSVEETEQAFKNISSYLRIKPNCKKAVVCSYTTTPDSGFVIDRLPEMPEVVLASPCSGHGFKHSAAVGELLKEMVTSDSTGIDISSFSLSRLS